MEIQTRTAVQMNGLARNFAQKLAAEAPVKCGSQLSYTKVYFRKLYSQCVKVEPYLEDTFQKHVSNNGYMCSRCQQVKQKGRNILPSYLRQFRETADGFRHPRGGIHPL